MIEVAPVRLIGDDPVYEVLPAHLEVLTARGFTYEVVPGATAPGGEEVKSDCSAGGVIGSPPLATRAAAAQDWS